MKFLVAVLVFLYSLIFAVLGSLIMAIAMKFVTLADIIRAYDLITVSAQMQLVVGLSGLVVALVSICMAQSVLGTSKKGRLIEFTNPAGKVSIELSAIEEFIKRIAGRMATIKDLKVRVIIHKKSIEAVLRVSLWGAIHVPDATARMQEDIKRRLQNMLGIEEEIRVTVHIVKILKRAQDEEQLPEGVPDAREPFPKYGN